MAKHTGSSESAQASAITSFVKLPTSLLRSRGLSHTAKDVLLLLADHEHRVTGQCNPRIDTLAAELGRCYKTVTRALAELRAIGLVDVAWGQRGSSYQVAARAGWDRILIGQKCPNRKILIGQKCPNTLGQKCPIRASVSINEPDLLNQKEYVPPPPPVELMKRADPLPSETAAAAAPKSLKTEPEKNGHADPATALLSELLAAHPQPGQPEKARSVLRDVLAQGADVATIRANHAAWCAWWELGQARFIPQLWRWLASGDWQFPPGPAAMSRKMPGNERRKSRREEVLDVLRSKLCH